MAYKKNGRCLSKLFEVIPLYIKMEIVILQFNQTLLTRVN
jgi:hypothetical protein